MELFSIIGKIAVDGMDTFNQNMDTASGKSESFASKLGKGAKTVATVGTAIVGASVGAVAGLTNFAKSSASTADNVDKMSQKIGVSRTAYQELDFICSQTGTSVDGLQAGMKTLTTVMDTTAKGTSKEKTALEELGISATDSEGNLRSSEDVMWETLEALQGMENQTEKSRLAVKLFGKSGTELMPLLNGASGSIEEMKDQAHDLGLVLSDEVIDNGVELTDSLDQTERAFKAIGTNLGASLMPIVTKASDYIQKFLPQIQTFIGRLTPIITKMFDSLLPPLMSMAEQVFPEIMNLIEELLPTLSQIFSSILPIITQFLQLIAPILVQLAQMVLPVLMDILSAFLPILQPLFKILEPILNLVLLLLTPLLKLIDLVLPLLLKGIELMLNRLGQIPDDLKKWVENCKVIFNFMKKVATEVFGKVRDKIVEIFNKIKEKVTSIWTKIRENVEKAINTIKEKVTSVFTAIKTFFSNVWDNIKTNVTTKITNIKNTISNVFNTVKNTVSNIFNNIKTAISTPIESAKNAVSGALDKIKTAFSDKLNKAKDTVKGIIDKIKGFFNFTFNIPKIKLPHFGITPEGWKFSDLLQGSIPKLGIDWYAKAMNNPVVMESPTAFGVNSNGQIMAGGERGSEVVSGTQTLMNMISSAVGSQMARLASVIGNAVTQMMSFLNQFTGLMPIIQSMNETLLLVKKKERKDKNATLHMEEMMMAEVIPTMHSLDDSIHGNMFGMMEEMRKELTEMRSGMMAYIENNMKTEKVLHNMRKDVQSIAGMSVVLDSGAMVGQLAPKMDKALGRLALRNERGA